MVDISRDDVRIRGDEIVDGVVHRRCPKCHKLLPLDALGCVGWRGRGRVVWICSPTSPVVGVADEP